jgi:integrase/recombinase XerD
MTVLADFGHTLTAEGLSHNTRRAYMADIDGYLQWAETDEPERIRASEYLNWLRTKRFSNATINRKAAALRKFHGDVLQKYKLPPAPDGEPHPLPELMKDVRKMLAASEGEVRLAIALMGFAGLRVSEARQLDWSDIDDEEIVVYGKGSKIRRVPLAPELRFVIDHHESDTLITMTDRGIRRAVTVAGERALIERPVASHDLRMTFGTVVYNYCKDLRVVQELLGHASSKTTERYTGVAQAAKTAAVNGALL